MFQKLASALLVVLLGGTLLAGCNQDNGFKDGVYRAEVENYDSRGYKDYLVVTVAGSQIASVEFDAVDAEENLKTQDEKYAEDMEKVQETYPEKFSGDLVNQMLETQDIAKVDAIAGASYSSEVFTALFKALEPQMVSGNQDTLVIENLPEH